MGDLLFSVVNLARHLGVDAEVALTAANRKFERRFRAMEAGIEGRGADLGEMTLDEMESEWQAAKKALESS